MKLIKTGKIIKATDKNILHDGKPPVGFTIEITDDTQGTGGYYIFFNNPEQKKGRGYNQWHESLDEVKKVITSEESRGMEIKWENDL